MTERHPGVMITGLVLVIIGVAFLFQELGAWTISTRYFFPVLLIAIGIGVVFGGRSSREADE